MIDAYALSLAALLLTAGSLADRFGRRLLFAIGIVVFTAGSLLCGLAGDPTFLALARAGQGIGGALMFATALALISGSYNGRDRGIALPGGHRRGADQRAGHVGRAPAVWPWPSDRSSAACSPAASRAGAASLALIRERDFVAAPAGEPVPAAA